jgi:hypothetical protein
MTVIPMHKPLVEGDPQMPDGQEPRFAASFEWLLMRINDTLPLTGWKITDRYERYRLERITQSHHEGLMDNARR